MKLMTARTIRLSWTRAIVGLALISLVVLIASVSRSDTAHASSFNPQSLLTFANQNPNATSDIVTTFNIAAPDAYFADAVRFAPEALGVPTAAAVPLGAKVGTLQSSKVTLGLINSSCANLLFVNFTFFNSTVNTSDTIAPLPPGTSDALAPLAGDNNKDGIAEIKPSPVVTKYPTFLNTLFGGVTPRARYAAATRIPEVSAWVILQLVVFEPGTTLPGLPAFDSALGYPTVTVLNDTTIDPAPSAVTDTCSPLITVTTLFGVTQDHPDIAGDQGGVAFRTNPGDGPRSFVTWARSQRDADNDGIENALDPCPFDVDTVWDPRFVPPAGQTVPGDSDTFGPFMISDGIPDTCDPTAEASGMQPTDHDNDGFLNRGDNCPIIANPGQEDQDDDSIGDACDTLALGNGPTVADGHRHEVARVETRQFGGECEGSTLVDIPIGDAIAEDVAVCATATPVEIDIKPGGDPNSTNLGSMGVIPVAILTTPAFDATTVDPATVDFEGASPAHDALQDVDEDGDLDLIMHFRTQETNIADDATEGCLTGETTGGQPIEGCDTVRIVPPDLDSDGDGWGDAVEADLATDQFAACATDASHDAWPADLNNDGLSDIMDLVILAGSFGQAVPPTTARHDIAPDPLDGLVDITDLAVVAGLFGQGCAGS